MKRSFLALAAALLVLPSLTSLPLASAATNSGFPFTDEELHYSINWPSGLSLGEGHLTAKKNSGEWKFELMLDAGVPGFAVKDDYRSESTGDLCSGFFSKRLSHGSKKSDETTIVDRSRGVATRATIGGGKTDIPVSDCAKDALAYLFWSRRELGQGRVPKAQQVLFGAAYQTNFEYAGAAVIRVNEKDTQTDKMICTLKGPASDIHFEMYVARDAARTPLLFRVPLAMGTFSMELVR